MSSLVAGYGHAFPSRIVTNDDLSKTLDTSDSWVTSRTGIVTRRIAAKEDSTASLGARAAENAMAAGQCAANDIDAIILATTTPDHPMPSTAAKIQSMIGARKAFAFDVQAVCSGFIYALSIADHFIKGGAVKNVLVIGAEVMSKVLDWTDRSTCVLFGDGAGALLLQAKETSDRGEALPIARGVLSTHLFSDGNFYDMLYVDGQATSSNPCGVLKMNGRAVFAAAVEKMVESSELALAHNQLQLNDIDWFVAHQANKRIIDAVAERLGIPEEKVIITVDKYANTSAATIPSTLSIAASERRILPGHTLLLSAIGGGFTWGAAVLKW
ncbi:MAG: ketoacyl-ACP synthase III [Holosporales bacterium]|nr:ketoacyl-ACP synthase III [Holosporales bacterium]